MGDYMYTNTKHYQIRRRAVMSYDKVPADGSMRMEDETMDLLEPYDYKDLQEFQMPYLAGYQAEKYDRRPKDVYPRIQERLNEYTRQKVRDTIHGYTTVNNIRFQNTYRGTNAVYTLLPVWLHRYRYKGKTYQFAMNGQTGKIVGKPPISETKVGKWFGLIAAGILARAFCRRDVPVMSIKRKMTAFLVGVWIMVLSVAAPVQAEKQYVFDYAGVLTDSEVEQLDQLAREVGEAHGIDILVVFYGSGIYLQ